MPQQNLSREEIALLEVGRTDISRPASWVLTVLFLLTIGTVPVAQHVYEIAQYSCGERGRALPQAYDIFRDLGSIVAPAGESGRTPLSDIFRTNRMLLRRINEYEDALEDASLLSKTLLPPTQLLMSSVLGVGNEKAYCGRNGWLFYRAGVDHLTGPGFLDPKQLTRRAASGNEWNPSPQPDPRKAILQFRRQLAAREIELIVMPTPVKPTTHPDQFSGRFGLGAGPVQNPSHARFLADLEREGVRVFDPTSAIAAQRRETGAPQYLETDTHWRPETVELVAEQLAEYISQSGIRLPEQEAAGYVRRRTEVENLGDVAAMLNLPEGQQRYRKQKVGLRQVVTKGGDPWQGGPDADILFLGDSFSNIYSLGGMGWGRSAGLVEQLSFILQRPIERVSRNDAGAYATRQILSRELARGNDCLAGKRLVIWQFAARELSVGDWRMLDLKLGEKPEEPAATAPEGHVIVQAKVHAVAPVPKPRSVPYKDCITSAHLVDLVVDAGQLEDQEVLVFVWGMRNNKWTPPATWKRGMTVKLRLVPWSKVEKTYGSYNRMELDDDDLLLLDPYWGEIEE